MTIWTAASIGATCALGLVVGLNGRSYFNPSKQIALYPPVIEVREGHMQGAPLTVQFRLANESRSPVTITALSKSCGCMIVNGKAGELQLPFMLDGGKALPIELSVETGARVGMQSYNLEISADHTDDPSLKAKATVRVNVHATMRADPATVIVRQARQGVSHAAQIRLADLLPDPGVEIREIKLSNPRTMQVAMTPDCSPSAIFGEQNPGRLRATLALTYTPDHSDGQIEEMISVVPKDRRLPVLQIPMFCEMAEPAYELVPNGLTIVGATGAPFQRTIVCRTRDETAEVALADCPQELTVQISAAKASKAQAAAEAGSERIIKVNGIIPKETPAATVGFKVNGQDLRLPIRFNPLQ